MPSYSLVLAVCVCVSEGGVEGRGRENIVKGLRDAKPVFADPHGSAKLLFSYGSGFLSSHSALWATNNLD